MCVVCGVPPNPKSIRSPVVDMPRKVNLAVTTRTREFRSLSMMEAAPTPNPNPAGTGGSRPAPPAGRPGFRGCGGAGSEQIASAHLLQEVRREEVPGENAAFAHVTSAGFTFLGLYADESRPLSPSPRRDVLRNFTALLRHTKLGHLRGLGLKERT